jgi:hypothetical protein
MELIFSHCIALLLIGITPALSAIEANRDSRRINLIWVVRDASMLVFFLENAKLDEKGLNLIFYTGKVSLPDTIENYHHHFNNGGQHVKIIKGRPDLSYVIPNIIEFVDKGGINWEKAMMMMNEVKVDEEVDTDETTTDDSSSDLKRRNDGITMGGNNVPKSKAINNHHNDDDYGQSDLEARGKSDSFTNDQKYYGYDDCYNDEEDEEWARPLVPFTKSTSRPMITKEPLNDMQQHSLFRTTSIGDLSGGLKDTWRASSMPKVWKEKVGTRNYIKTTMAKDHLETVRLCLSFLD